MSPLAPHILSEVDIKKTILQGFIEFVSAHLKGLGPKHLICFVQCHRFDVLFRVHTFRATPASLPLSMNSLTLARGHGIRPDSCLDKYDNYAIGCAPDIMSQLIKPAPCTSCIQSRCRVYLQSKDENKPIQINVRSGLIAIPGERMKYIYTYSYKNSIIKKYLKYPQMERLTYFKIESSKIA